MSFDVDDLGRPQQLIEADNIHKSKNFSKRTSLNLTISRTNSEADDNPEASLVFVQGPAAELG